MLRHIIAAVTRCAMLPLLLDAITIFTPAILLPLFSLLMPLFAAAAYAMHADCCRCYARCWFTPWLMLIYRYAMLIFITLLIFADAAELSLRFSPYADYAAAVDDILRDSSDAIAILICTALLCYLLLPFSCHDDAVIHIAAAMLPPC